MHEYAKSVYDIILQTSKYYYNLNIDKSYTHSMQGFTEYVKQSLLQFYHQSCTIANCYISDLGCHVTKTAFHISLCHIKEALRVYCYLFFS